MSTNFVPKTKKRFLLSTNHLHLMSHSRNRPPLSLPGILSALSPLSAPRSALLLRRAGECFDVFSLRGVKWREGTGRGEREKLVKISFKERFQGRTPEIARRESSSVRLTKNHDFVMRFF